MPDEYRIEGLHRACDGCGRLFRSGEQVMSVVLLRGEAFERRDLCAACKGKSVGEPFSYWRSRYPGTPASPLQDMGRVQRFFDHLLRLADAEGEVAAVRFFTALVLLRRRRLRFAGTRSEGGRQWLLVEKVWDGERAEVPDPGISQERLESVRRRMQELFQAHLQAESPVPAGQ